MAKFNTRGKKMKILFFISNIANGGAERVLQVLSNEFIDLGIECEIIYFENDLKLYNFKANTTKLEIYGNKFSKFSKFFKIRKFIKNKNPDLIISFMDQTNINLIISTMFMNKKLIITEHVSHEVLKSKFWRFIRDFSYKFANGLSVLNQSDFKYYSFVKHVKILPNPIFVIQKSAQKENIILSVARLEKIKGYENYFEALSLIDTSLLASWKIVIAGDGSLRQDLENLAKKLNLNIDFIGHQNDLSDLYAKAKILVLSSLSEAFGNVLAEACFYQIARLSTATNGAKELINDEFDGLICDFTSLDISNKLQMLLKDENLIQKLASNAKLRSNELKPQNIAKKWLDFIKEC